MVRGDRAERHEPPLWMRSQGFTSEVFDGRPVIGIATTWSELAPCNVHLHRVAESVKRGVWQAGGFPLEFPTMALGETLLRPTAQLVTIEARLPAACPRPSPQTLLRGPGM